MNTALLEAALDETTFAAEAYKLDIPTLDGRSARNSSLRFAGNAKLDATSADDAAILRAARIGCEVRLIVVGTVAQKAFSLNASGEELNYSFAVRVTSVEAGDLA